MNKIVICPHHSRDVKTEADDSSQDKEYDAAGNLRTVTSTMSVSDYFAKKMAEIKAKRSGSGSSAVDQFCENTRKKAEEAKATEMVEENRPLSRRKRRMSTLRKNSNRLLFPYNNISNRK